MRRPAIAALAAIAMFATACGGAQITSDPPADVSSAPPAAGSCLRGATDCQDVGALNPPGPPTADPGLGDGVDPDAPDQTVSTSAPTDPDGGVSDLASTPVEPTPGLEKVHAIGWDRVEVDPQRPTLVTVHWVSGVAPCNALSGVDVAFTQDAVTLTVREGSVPSPEPQACIEIAQYKSTTITLDQPVGPRSIIDGADA